MQVHRKMVGLVAGASLAAGSLLAVTPAQADDTARTVGAADWEGGDKVLRTPSDPVGADVGVLATSPQISPAAERIRYVTSNTDYTCASGRLCTRVWDPVVKKWKVFDLWVCKTYSLSYWGGTGGYVNWQTKGTKAIFYKENGTQHSSSTAPTSTNSYNWNPVWKIKNC
ncbi:hypothetical protein ACWGQ9_12955 [Streptomyces parvus]